MLFIYNITGYYLIVPLVLAISKFLLATFNLITNHNNVFLRLIQLISLAFIVFIILINVKSLIFGDNLYKFAFIFPFSINKITYLDDIYSNEHPEIYYLRNSYINRLYILDYNEISDFLNNLDNDKIYVITFDFIISWLQYDEDSPVINLTKPILITKNSNPVIIAKFIQSRINDCINTYCLDDSIIYSNKNETGVIVKYKEINIF